MYNSIVGNLYDQAIIHVKMENLNYPDYRVFQYRHQLVGLRIALDELLGPQLTLPYTGHHLTDYESHAKCYWEIKDSVLEFGLVPNGKLFGLPIGIWIDYQGTLYQLKENGLVLPDINC